MKDHKKDYTNTFRNLINNNQSFKDQKGMLWLKKYQERLDLEEVNEKERIALMNSSNPKYILRNYLAQEAIQAAELGDFSSLNLLVEVLKDPYVEKNEFSEFSKAPPEWGKKLEISCSS